MSLTPERLAQLLARAEAATTGPWTATQIDAHTTTISAGGQTVRTSVRIGHVRPDDAEFIAGARTDVPALLAEVDRLRQELAARPTRAEVLREAADTLVAACPDHGERSECRMTCACDVAAELRMDAAGHPMHETPVLPWLPLLDDEDRDSLAVALEEEVYGGTDNVMRGLEHLLSRYRRLAHPAPAPAADGGAR